MQISSLYLLENKRFLKIRALMTNVMDFAVNLKNTFLNSLLIVSQHLY